ncbi:MAG: tyrosine-type recombinase/integrase [Alistipes sp.]|nr:tyrosine-type recombinase/integrase [Candidatus Alistipes equi]
MTVEDFITYIQTQQRYSPLTVRNYSRDLERFVCWMSERGSFSYDQFDPTKVTSQDIREWIIYRLDHDKISAASMNRELSTISSYFRFLRSRSIVDGDIFKNIKKLKVSQRLPVFVPESRMNGICETLQEESYSGDFRQQRDALIIEMLYTCGLRLQELCSLRFDICTAASDTIKVRGKGDKERIVPLLGEMQRRLRAYYDTVMGNNIPVSSSSALILNEQGDAYSRSSIQRVVLRELSKGNVQGRKSPHVLRHTFATHLLNKDADMRDIQELMGHASLKTTQHYTHNSIAKLQEIYSKAHPHK